MQDQAINPEPQSVQRVQLSPDSPDKTPAAHNTPGSLILQWLTYASWGWFALVMAWLLHITMLYYFDTGLLFQDSITIELVAYSLAGVLVLFLFSVVCDLIYQRKEPVKKTNAASIIMVVHAVIFTLFGLGFIIYGVFSFVSMLLNISDTSGYLSIIGSAVLSTVVYSLILVRTIYPAQIKHIRRIVLIILSFMALVVGAMAIAGPAVQASKYAADRDIEQNLPSIASEISRYVTINEKLPDDLEDISGNIGSKEAKEIIHDNRVRYNKSEKVQKPAYSGYKYQLCVDYASEKIGYSYDLPEYQPDSRPETSTHPKGAVCYDLLAETPRDQSEQLFN